CMWLPARKRSNKKLLTNSGNVCSDVNTTRSIIDCASWMDRDAGTAAVRACNVEKRISKLR
ncbi:hypothetical protein COEREDRAFT_83407, partial [Coemansia reversa NRRL 1564]